MRHKRFQARRGGGRFTRNTPENTLGLHIAICAACRTFNPYPVGEPMPATCHHCGEALVDIAAKKPRAEGGCDDCGLSGTVPMFIDPGKFRRGLLCGTCGREKE
jgi:hypothetical protein